ncbi:50S ribosomal protein L32 [Candidatus Woesebacteria bacterium]|nr:50S ribosomal protein L32 [Candidatus Woesebacteria bacterium]
MAPTPKKKHSTQRTGTRRATKKQSLPEIVYDKDTGKPRLSHRKATR